MHPGLPLSNQGRLMDDKDAEIARLKAQLAERVDGGLSKLASHATRERGDYQRLQSGGDVNAPEIHETAMEAATYILADWGL